MLLLFLPTKVVSPPCTQGIRPQPVPFTAVGQYLVQMYKENLKTALVPFVFSRIALSPAQFRRRKQAKADCKKAKSDRFSEKRTRSFRETDTSVRENERVRPKRIRCGSPSFPTLLPNFLRTPPDFSPRSSRLFSALQQTFHRTVFTENAWKEGEKKAQRGFFPQSF